MADGASAAFTSAKNSKRSGDGISGLVGVGGNWCGGVGARALDPGLQAIHVDVNDGRGEEREHLAEDEAAYDGDAEGTAEFGANAGAQRQRHGAEKRGHSGH